MEEEEKEIVDGVRKEEREEVGRRIEKRKGGKEEEKEERGKEESCKFGIYEN